MRLFRRGSGSPDDGSRWIVVGLGNPGKRYAANRHNLGAMVLAELVERTGGSLRSHRSGCLVSEANLQGTPVVLARPTSFMNESGRPVGALLRWYKVPPERTIVAHDELDIPFGQVRIKLGGGTAGHNGLRSVAGHIGDGFVRVRCGIGRPRGSTDPTAHVLSDFSAAERKELPWLIGAGADAAEKVVAAGAERAMNEVNTR